MMKKLWIVVLVSTFYMNTALAQQNDIAIFKNGTAFLVKKKQINAEEGVFMLKELPEATFGTLWFVAENNQIKQVSSFTEELLTNVNIANIEDLLKTNINKKGIFIFGNTSVEGTLESVINNMLIIKTNSGKYYTNNLNSCQAIEFADKPATTIEKKESKKIIKLEFAKKTNTQALQIMYLAKGISWVPSYHIDLVSENQAKIVLRATLMNDLEDIENANMNLVVGVPNFAYTYLQSPLISTEDVANFLAQLNRYSNQFYGGSNRPVGRADITTQSFSNYINTQDIGDIDELTIAEIEGKQAEDFFFYQLKNITLKKKGRMFQDILQHSLSYEHLYEVEIKTNNTSSYTNENENSTINNNNLVHHSINIKNDSKLPWTTGTVLLTKPVDGVAQPIGQDKLNYTPVGGKAKIALSVVPDISVKDSEKEVERKVNIKQKDGYFYDLVTVEASIEVKSFKNTKIDLKIKRSFYGEALNSTIAWETKKLVNTNSYQYNPSTNVEWNIKLEEGKSETIMYKYQFYVKK
jgi:hypothetical protein